MSRYEELRAERWPGLVDRPRPACRVCGGHEGVIFDLCRPCGDALVKGPGGLARVQR